MDLTTLTAAVDFDGVGTAILAIAAAMIIVKVGMWGVRRVMGFIR